MNRSNRIDAKAVRGLAGAGPATPPTPPAAPAETSNGMPDYLTLGQASKLAPGHPSTNCLWRWCRRGVLARSGQRVRLRHIRAGGKVMTTAAWIAEFCSALAAADAEYFDAKDQSAVTLPPRDLKFAPPSRQKKNTPGAWAARDDAVRTERELDEEGL